MRYNILFPIGIIFLILGFLYNEAILLGLGLFIIVILYISILWINSAYKNLSVTMTSKRNASFKEKPFEITYSIENKSILPYPNIELIVSFHRNINILEELKLIRNEGYYNFYKLNFSVPPKTRITKKINCIANKRGNYFIGDLKLNISDPFNLNNKIFNKVKYKEIGIYPNIYAINNINQFFNQLYGSKKSNKALIEDRILPKGAREYIQSDPFTKIDWKATGKYNKLFTKQYEFTTHKELWILSNLKTNDKTWMGTDEDEVEQVISATASLAYLFSSNNISYNILMNAKLVRSNNLYKLSAKRKKDLENVLYQLAKLKSYISVNYIHTLKYVKKDIGLTKPTIILVSTYLSQEVKQQISLLKREGYKVIYINPLNEGVEANEDMGVLYKSAT